MSELADFLLARYAEDEAVAREAIANEGVRATPGMPPWPGETYNLSVLKRGGTLVYIPTARVLADVEAKRRIVRTSQVASIDGDGSLFDRLAMPAVRATLTTVLRALALPYADHPDYRDEWAA